MPIQHAIWSVSDIPKPLTVGRLPNEQLLEDMIIRDPRILSMNPDFSQFGLNWPNTVIVDVQASTLVHEGSHGLDARAVGHDPRNIDEALKTERQAYWFTSRIHELLRSRGIPAVWDPTWPAATAEAQRKAAIEAAAQNSVSGWRSPR